MNNLELRTLLEQLHNEMEHTETLDEKGRELLRDLGDDIRELLARADSEENQAKPNLIGRLEESITYLQVTHPALTTSLSSLLETLSNAGI